MSRSRELTVYSGVYSQEEITRTVGLLGVVEM